MKSHQPQVRSETGHPRVGRTMTAELGENTAVRINNGDRVFSTSTEFTGDDHGFEGISFDAAVQ